MSQLQTTNENAVVEVQTESPPMTLIQQALASDIGPEQLKQLLDMQERYEANIARKEYSAAMNDCQKDLPAIFKSQQNTHTRSTFEDLGEMIERCKPVYTRCGFSFSFHQETIERPDWIRVVCVASHRGGCSQEKYLDLPMDGAGLKGASNKTGVQAIASSLSYARRYLLKLVLNIATTSDENCDGNSEAEAETISAADCVDMSKKIIEAGCDESLFLEWATIESLDQMPLDKVETAFGLIKQKNDKRIREENDANIS